MAQLCLVRHEVHVVSEAEIHRFRNHAQSDIFAAMARKPEIVAGIAWFRADQWQLLRSLSTDADELEKTYEEWVAIAEKAVQDLARQGVFARKVDVDVNELQRWCSAQKRPLDSSARAQYAAAHLPDSQNA